MFKEGEGSLKWPNQWLQSCSLLTRYMGFDPKEGHWAYSRKTHLVINCWTSIPFEISNNKIYETCSMSKVVRKYKKQDILCPKRP